MTVTHRTLAGGWELCAAQGACELLFHFPDVTPEEMAGAPLRALLPLLEITDPPAKVFPDGSKAWGQIRKDRFGVAHTDLHRDYDLPALVSVDGAMYWFQHTSSHRDGDQPAKIQADGTLEWWVNGERHREHGYPAWIDDAGGMGWYEQDKLHRTDGRPAAVVAPGRWGKQWELHFAVRGEQTTPIQKVSQCPEAVRPEWLRPFGVTA